MSRSVSLPSSVTNTSPCWNGLIVPGSMFRYGSNFCTWTLRPRAFSSRPSEAATMPLPSAETTPPVTNTYFVGRSLIASSGWGSGLRERRSGRFPGESPRARNLAWERSRPLRHGRPPPGRSSADRREELLPAEHALDLVLALRRVELGDRGARLLARELLDAEVPLRPRRDLREVRDRQDLGARGQPLERRGDRVCGASADAGVDLVEDERVAAAHRGEREGDAGELAARRRLGDGRER